MKRVPRGIDELERAFFRDYWTNASRRGTRKTVVCPSLVVKPSTIPGARNGLFCSTGLSKGTLIKVESDMWTAANDPMFELSCLESPRLRRDPLAFEAGLIEARAAYFARGHRLNVRPAHGDGLYEVIRDVSDDGELFRAYTWTGWLKEISDMDTVLSGGNLKGFMFHVASIAERSISGNDLFSEWIVQVIPRFAEWLDVRFEDPNASVQILHDGTRYQLVVDQHVKLPRLYEAKT